MIYEQSVLKLFFNYPMKKFGVRELSRMLKLDTKTVMKYLNIFIKRKIIVKKKEEGRYPYYEANRTSTIYRHEKSEVIIKKIFTSGLIEFLEKELNPTAIVLFGSVQKGTYHPDSDVDIFIYGNYKRLDLHQFKKRIGYNINLFFENNLYNLSKSLLENIYNGLVLSGKVEIIK